MTRVSRKAPLRVDAKLLCCCAVLVSSGGGCTAADHRQDAGRFVGDATDNDAEVIALGNQDADVVMDGGNVDARMGADGEATLDASELLDAGDFADSDVSAVRDAETPLDAQLHDAQVDASGSVDDGVAGSQPYPALLSQTGLFPAGSPDSIASSVRSFQPRYALWSDGATKRRWLLLPQGAQINSANMDAWQYPVGTKVWKEFSVNGVRLETRMLHKRAERDWVLIAYRWRADGSDAEAAPRGEENVRGMAHDIPAQDACARCHSNTSDAVLGASALQLSHALPGLTLQTLIAENLLSRPPSVAGFQIPGGPLAEQALGYLHANCGHCHQPNSPAYEQILKRTPHTGGPILWERTNALGSLEQTVGYATTVGQPNSILPDLAIIEPGYPERSELFIRIGERGLGSLQMPPLGTELVDDSGRAAVRAWISSLPRR